jgi:ubiquinone/menaquinone biosynthesis C-methylase UbiE
MVCGRERYWSHYSRSYDEDAEYVVGKALRQAIAEKLRGERGLGDVVEFGCGTGYFTKAIAEHAGQVIATDLSDEMLEVARTQLKALRNVTLQKEDCESPSFESLRFDTVFLANVVHTIENPRAALAESHRILKDGGLLLIISYTDYSTNWFERMALGIRYFQKFGMPPGCYRNYSPDELVRLVENAAGFTMEEIQLISDTAKALYLKARKK